MAWLLIVAFGVVATVARVVVPRRMRGPTGRFPWFWVVFPLTCVAVACATAAFTTVPGFVNGDGSFWWNLSLPDNEPSLQFLSNEQYRRFETVRYAKRILPLVAVAGIVACVWAWRRGRR